MNTTRNKQERCVMARLMRQGQKHQKNFSLANFGTWKAAEKAASAWVEQQKKILPPSQLSEKGRMTNRNKSGVVGVYLSKRTTRSTSGEELEYWTWSARWPGCPLTGGVKWPISSKLNEDDAFTLAVLARDLETVDRDFLRKKLSRIRNTKSHKAIVDKKLIYLK